MNTIGPKKTNLQHIDLYPVIRVETQPSPEATVSNQTQNSITSEPTTTLPLNITQKKTFISIIKKPYFIHGKNGIILQINLHWFLNELLQRLRLNLQPESVSIALIGSAVGSILDPQQAGYNDLDFLIQIRVPIQKSHLYNMDLVKSSVSDLFYETTKVIKACLASQLKLPCFEGILNHIGDNYFNHDPTYINTPLNYNDLPNPSDNRCSIVKLGMLEFKTAIDFYVVDEQETVAIIPGLKYTCAFHRDSFRISLTTELLENEEIPLEIPLEVHTSDVPFTQAIEDLKNKQLHTARIDGSKCLKGIDNITFKGCFYLEEDVNRAIYIDFLKHPNSPQKLKNHFGKYQNVIALACGLSNFFINGSNLEVDSKLLQPFYEMLPLPEELTSTKAWLKWIQLLLFLSAVQKNTSSSICELHVDGNIYYLVKPKNILRLLQEFMKLHKDSEIPFENLPKLDLSIETLPQLFAKVKPHIKREQIVSFNHSLLSYCPSALDEEENLKIEMLTPLLTLLSTLDSPKKRLKLIKHTESLINKINPNTSFSFDKLRKLAQADDLQISLIICTAIQDLAQTSRKIALDLWSYADQEQFLSACDELEAFVCLEGVNPRTLLSKKQQLNLLERMLFRLSFVSKNLPSEDNQQLTSFEALFSSLALQLSHEDLNLKDLDFIESLLKEISPLSTSLKEKIESKFLDAFIRLTLEKKLGETEQEIILNIIDRILNISTPQAVENYTNKALCYLQTVSKSDKISKFVASALQNPSIVSTLLKQKTRDVNERILLLINNSQLVVSPEAAQNLYKLFRHFCKNISLEKNNLIFVMLKMLIQVFPNLESIPVRQTFLEQIRSHFEENHLNVAPFFKNLTASENLNLAPSSLFLMCIQELALTAPKIALSLWDYTEKEHLFADSAVNELNAFACIQETGLKEHLKKEQLIMLITKMMDRLDNSSQKLNVNDIPQLDSFNAHLLHLINKLCQENFNFDDLKFIQKPLGKIATLHFISESIKQEIIDDLLNSCIRLAPQKMGKGQLNLLLEILKEILKTYPKETVGKVVRCLRAFPNGPKIAGGLLKNSLFTSTLLEDLKEGTVENSLDWLAVLNQKNLLQSNEQKYTECCISLVNDWSQTPDSQLCSKLLPVLQTLYATIEKKNRNETDVELKNQALKSCIGFVQACTKVQGPPLIEEARKALKAISKFISAPEKATFYSDLICACSKSDHAANLFNEVLKQNIFNENTPVELLKAYKTVFTLLTKNNTVIPFFVETFLENFAFIDLLLNPETKDANELILLLFNSYNRELTRRGEHQEPSSAAIGNLILLFEQLYLNRNTSQDSTLDLNIRGQTGLLLKFLDRMHSITFDQWIALTNALILGKSLFLGYEELEKQVFSITLDKIAISIAERISNRDKIKPTYNLLSKICQEYEELPCFPTTASILRKLYLAILGLLDKPQELLQKLNSFKDDSFRFNALEHIIIYILKREKREFTNDATKTIEQALEMFEYFREPKAAAKGHKFNLFNSIFELFDGLDHNDNQSLPFVNKVLEIADELFKSHPDKFKNIEITSVMVINDACRYYCLSHAYSMLACALGKNNITDKDHISQLEYNMQIRALKLIQSNIDQFKNQISEEGRVNYLENMARNSNLLDALLHNLSSEQANELILLLVDNFVYVQSEVAVNKLKGLFKQICKQDNIEKISFKLLYAMEDLFEVNAMVNKDMEILHALTKKRYLTFAVDCTEELLRQLQDMEDPSQRSRMILNTIILILKNSPRAIQEPSNKMLSLFDMLERDLSSIHDMNLVVDIVLTLLDASTDDEEPSVVYFLQILETCFANHSEKFSNLKNAYKIVLESAISKDYFDSASNIQKIAFKQKINLDPIFQQAITPELEDLNPEESQHQS